jgi:polyhydroxybutyrate depolymerase
MFRYLTICLAIGIVSCSDKDDTGPLYQVGKNRFTLTIGGDVREYFVHVPELYNEGNATPVVFMLHGTSGDGDRFYNISGWKEVGEAENILTVFPSSWQYCIIDDDDEVEHLQRRLFLLRRRDTA